MFIFIISFLALSTLILLFFFRKRKNYSSFEQMTFALAIISLIIPSILSIYSHWFSPEHKPQTAIPHLKPFVIIDQISPDLKYRFLIEGDEDPIIYELRVIDFIASSDTLLVEIPINKKSFLPSTSLIYDPQKKHEIQDDESYHWLLITYKIKAYDDLKGFTGFYRFDRLQKFTKPGKYIYKDAYFEEKYYTKDELRSMVTKNFQELTRNMKTNNTFMFWFSESKQNKNYESVIFDNGTQRIIYDPINRNIVYIHSFEHFF